jgi:hypothetical protein
MNKFFLILYITLFIVSCNNDIKKTNLTDKAFTQENNRNDTICYSKVFPKPLSKKIKSMYACHIVYSDSLSKKRQASFSGGKLNPEYNFDNYHSDQFYKKNGDSISLKLLLLVRERFTIFPDTLFLMGDTLFLRQRWVSNGKKLKGFEMEEFYYRLVVEKDFKPIIRYYIP